MSSYAAWREDTGHELALPTPAKRTGDAAYLAQELLRTLGQSGELTASAADKDFKVLC